MKNKNISINQYHRLFLISNRIWQQRTYPNFPRNPTIEVCQRTYFHGDGLFKNVVCFDFRDAKRFLSIAKNPTRNQNSRWIHCRENVDFSEAPSTSSLPNDTHVSGAFVRSDGQANLDVLQRRLHGSAQHLQHRSLAYGRGLKYLETELTMRMNVQCL